MKHYLLLTGLAFGLMACGGTPEKSAPVTTSLPENVAEEISEDVAEVSVVIEEPETQAPQTPEEEKVVDRVIEVDDNPDQFLGASLSIVNEKIGAPVFSRRDGSIEVWQYRRDWKEGTCHLDLFLYPVSTSTGTDIKVKFTDLRSEFLTVEDQYACFAEMLRDHIRRHVDAPTS